MFWCRVKKYSRKPPGIQVVIFSFFSFFFRCQDLRSKWMRTHLLGNECIATVVAHIDDDDRPRRCSSSQLVLGGGQENSIKARQLPGILDHSLQFRIHVVALVDLTCQRCWRMELVGLTHPSSWRIELISKLDVFLCQPRMSLLQIGYIGPYFFKELIITPQPSSGSPIASYSVLLTIYIAMLLY
ncbi:hypothetical protein F4823DRAFT_174387 [Ustulina deusta]|nr:hypothetical protein F4823DRAFT_174387 [Ustulina deusta]